MNDIYTFLMEAMLKHGYKLTFQPQETGTWLKVDGPGFAGEKIVKDYPTAVGLAAYWLSETNGVAQEVKNDMDKILYGRKS